jgi:hypothetical protein
MASLNAVVIVVLVGCADKAVRSSGAKTRFCGRMRLDRSIECGTLDPTTIMKDN